MKIEKKLKKQFQDACKENSMTMSYILHNFIKSYVEENERIKKEKIELLYKESNVMYKIRTLQDKLDNYDYNQ
jgi:antitoxin component of RelBE/YafQ-DinJ toxin-antitoxin module